MTYQGRNWDHAAGIIWPALIAAAKRRQMLFYSDLSPLIDTNPLSVGYALGPIQTFCLESRLPPLTVIVVGKYSRVPGSGFIAWDMDDLDRAKADVFSYDWSRVENPYGHFGPEISKASLAAILLKRPAAAAEVMRIAPQRGVAQQIFKLALLEAYQYRCAMCETTFGCALEGAHIVPWRVATDSEKVDVRNGMLLCATHHRMFDGGVITLTRDHHVQYYDIAREDGPYTDMDDTLGTNLHGKLIRLPAAVAHHPDPAFIARRRIIDEWDLAAEAANA